MGQKSLPSVIEPLLKRVRHALPEGRSLPEQVWRRRHRGILVLLCLHAVGLGSFGVLRGFGVAHSALEGGAVAAAALLAGWGPGGRKFRAVVASFGLLTASAVLTHLSGGYIEMHFHFFVMLMIIALYQDWTPFLLAIGYVAVHHGVMGALAPDSVYNHPDALLHPWKWAGIHALFVLAASVASLVAWRLNEESRARAELILGSAGEGIYGVDVRGRITFVNPAAARMLGWGVGDLVGRPVHDVVHHTERPRPPAESPVPPRQEMPAASREDACDGCDAFASFADGVARHVPDSVFRRKGGTEFPAEYISTPIRQRGAVSGAVVTFSDITEQKSNAALGAGQARILEMIARGAPLEETLASIATMIEEHAEGAICSILLLDDDGATLRYGAAPSLPDAFREAAQQVPVGPASGSCGAAAYHGRTVIVADIAADPICADYRDMVAVFGLRACWSTPIVPAHGGKVLGTFCTFYRERRTPSERDQQLVERFVHLAAIAIERKTLEERLVHQAFHDPLTGLANRALVRDRVDHALARAGREPAPLAVLVLDADNFKTINDSVGHDAGDELLAALAERLRACVRPADTVARLGGDEFAILLEDIGDVSEAIAVAERIHQALQTAFSIQAKQWFLHASVGIAEDGSGQDGADEVLRNADMAMYVAKTRGKGRCEVFEPSMHTKALERIELEADLRRAVERREFAVHYQPVVELVTGRIVGVEALVRWEHPERGLLPPTTFISLAEDTGLIVPVGRWVLEEACRRTRAWQVRRPSDPPISVSVNLSARQLQHPRLVDEVVGALRQSGLDPGDLILEITETVLMSDAERTSLRLTELKELGVRLAIDDFGTGYSSLSHLRHFPIDVLKIDKSFIDGVARDPEESALARAILKLGHTLELETVAEGIERAEQLAQLRLLGCRLGQGYYFSEPLEKEAIDALLSGGPRGEFDSWPHPQSAVTSSSV